MENTQQRKILKESFGTKNLNRIENVREFEIDKLQMQRCFKPGDIVKAEVISLGDSYLLSTARNDLGVVYALSSSGASMIPISWQEMQCPETGGTLFLTKSLKTGKFAK